mgnify:CR=1 FL=1
MSKEKDSKLKALQLTLDKLDKTYGKGTVMKMGDVAIDDIDAISTGSLGLDLALGVGGYPRGRVIEIYGPESSGKTTLTLHAIAEAQKAGGIAAFIDAEHAFDKFYAEKLGIDLQGVLDKTITPTAEQLTILEQNQISPNNPVFVGFEIHNLYEFFMVFVILCGIASLILFALTPRLKKMMHGIR